jgi:hypothetical protein
MEVLLYTVLPPTPMMVVGRLLSVVFVVEWGQGSIDRGRRTQRKFRDGAWNLPHQMQLFSKNSGHGGKTGFFFPKISGM